jgi:hypothetical protein
VVPVAGLLGVGGTLPADAAPSCHGGTCTGKNPQTQGCSSGAVTVRTGYIWLHDNVYDGTPIELRYSPSAACRALWGRVHVDDRWNEVTVSIERKADVPNATTYRYTASGFDGDIYTAMFSRESHYSYRACLSEVEGTGCTTWLEG